MRHALLILPFVLLAATGNLVAATRLTAAANQSVVILDGSSNLAPWRCSAKTIDAQMLVATTPEHLNAVIDRIEDGNIGVWMSDPSAGRFDPPTFGLRISVPAFRCGSRVMESDMRKALRADDHPRIEFTFRELLGGVTHDIDSNKYRARIAGDLSLAGVTKRIELPVLAERTSRGTFRFRAELPLRMTDFGVTPPTALFGAIRARDELTVRFDLTLEIR